MRIPSKDKKRQFWFVWCCVTVEYCRSNYYITHMENLKPFHDIYFYHLSAVFFFHKVQNGFAVTSCEHWFPLCCTDLIMVRGNEWNDIVFSGPSRMPKFTALWEFQLKIMLESCYSCGLIVWSCNTKYLKLKKYQEFVSLNRNSRTIKLSLCYPLKPTWLSVIWKEFGIGWLRGEYCFCLGIFVMSLAYCLLIWETSTDFTVLGCG